MRVIYCVFIIQAALRRAALRAQRGRGFGRRVASTLAIAFRSLDPWRDSMRIRRLRGTHDRGGALSTRRVFLGPRTGVSGTTTIGTRRAVQVGERTP
jgi:hypothetical protein